MPDYVERDPWKAVPAKNRLDFKVVDEPLERLARATINKIDREQPVQLREIDGALPLFLLLSKLALTTYQTITFFCAETPEDPARNIEFVSSAPPLLRSLVDEVFSVVFLCTDLRRNVQWYYRSGWREKAEWGQRLRRQYGTNPEWKDWLDQYDELLEQGRELYGVTTLEKADLSMIKRWPTPGQMLKVKELPADTKALLVYLNDWFYRTLSQQTHLTYPGVEWRGGTMLRRRDDPVREGEWFKKRSDVIGDAVVFLLALLTEVNTFLPSDLRKDCAYIWGLWKVYDTGAAELYSMRYADLLRSPRT